METMTEGKMTSSDKAACVQLSLGVALVLGVVWAFAWGYVASWRALTEAGYTEEPRPGNMTSVWVAPAGK